MDTKRRVRAGRACGLVMASGLACAAHGQAIWTGMSGNNWATAANWSTGAVPGNGTTVTIPGGFPEVVSSFAINVAGINAESPLSIGAGQSTLGQASSFKDLTVTNDTITAGGPVTISGNSQMSGAAFSGGPWLNSGTMTVNPGLNINAPTIFTNTGTVNVQQSLTLSGPLASMMNNGTLALMGNANMHSGGLLTSANTFRKAGGGISTVEPRLLNGGTIHVQAGTLRLVGQSDFTGGAIVVDVGATLVLDHPSVGPHTFNGLGSVTGDGDMVIQTLSGGTPAVHLVDEVAFNLNGDSGLHLKVGQMLVSDILRNSGRMTFSSAYTVQGIGEVHNESGATLRILAGGTCSLTQNATLVNKGTVDMDGQLALNAGTFSNNAGGTATWKGNAVFSGQRDMSRVRNRGVMRRVGGSGTIHVPFDQSDGGKTIAEGGSVAFNAGGQWGFGGSRFELIGTNPAIFLGGAADFEALAGEHVFAGAGSVVQGVNSAVVVEPGASLRLEVFSSPPTPENEYRLQGGATLGGLGTILNRGQFDCLGWIGIGAEADFRNDGLVFISGGGLSGTFTNNAGKQVIHVGNWTIQAGKAVNDGEWICTPAAAMALMPNGLVPGEFRNNAQFLYAPPTPVGSTVSVKFDNPGHVIVLRGTLQFGGPVVQVVNGALTGGTWEVFPGATLILPPPLTKITTGARVIGAKTGQAGVQGLPSVSEISSGGTLEANGDITFNGQVNILNGGRLKVCAPATVTVPGRLYSGWLGFFSRVEQKVRTEGPDQPRIVTAVFENGAMAAPGGPDAAGPFNLTGIYLQTSEGVLETEIGGLGPITEHDRMDVTGAATLGGTLDLALIDGFVPALGQSFEILTATGGVSGQFAGIEQPEGMPAGLEFKAVYSAGSVSVVVGPVCYPDCNQSGTLTIADFGCFQTAFAAGAPYADCTANGSLTVADFACFQSAFAAGCP